MGRQRVRLSFLASRVEFTPRLARRELSDVLTIPRWFMAVFPQLVYKGRP